jgi:hypothetical protein
LIELIARVMLSLELLDVVVILILSIAGEVMHAWPPIGV